jgi:hypothetical protein
MRISTYAFESIIGHSATAQNEPGRNRSSRRVAVSKRTTLAHAGSTQQVPVTIIDVSLGGSSFICLSPLVPDEQFILRITGRDGKRVTVHCLVRWCSRTGSGRFRIGAEFLNLEEDDVLRPLEMGCA